MAKKSRYMQPAIVNDIVTFLCHFGIDSSHPVMRVCLQLMMKQINYLALDQLTVLASCLSGLDATRQTRVLREAIVVLCNNRADQLSALSVEHKIYLLREYGHRLQYSCELLQGLWDERRDLCKWQQAVGFFIALAKASTPTDVVESSRVPLRHEYLEEWCIDILMQQSRWLEIDDIEALLAAFVQLDVYDGELLRILGDNAQSQSSNPKNLLSVWNLLADLDYMHIGLMEMLLTNLRTLNIHDMTVETQHGLLAFLAEAVTYYNTDSSLESDSNRFGAAVSSYVEQLSDALQAADNIPAGNCFDLHNYFIGQTSSSHITRRCLIV